MSYKSDLQSNNDDLQAILNTINSLPEAGSSDGTGGSGNTDFEDDYLQGELVECINDKVTSIRLYAFYSQPKLSVVSFPNVSYIQYSAFQECSSLTKADFPNVTTIEGSAFAYCSSLTELNMPNLQSTGRAAFYQCAFTAINFPQLTSLASLLFDACSNVTTVSLPQAAYIGGSAFNKCIGLTTISLPKATSILNYAFKSCTNLSEIYLMSTEMCNLGSSNAFSGTGITSTTGSIFVPASLVDTYKAAACWKILSNRIFGI